MQPRQLNLKLTRILQVYQQKFMLRLLAIISGLWVLTMGLSYIYQLSTDTLCYTLLMLTCLMGILFWYLLTPWLMKESARLLSHSVKEQVMVHGGMLLILLALNQVFVHEGIRTIFNSVWGCYFSQANWLKNVIINNVLTNGLIYALIVGAAVWKEKGAVTFFQQTPASKPASQPYADTLRIKTGRSIEWIKTDAVQYIEANQNCIHIFTASQKYVIYTSLVKFSSQLDPCRFIRIHRAVIVNRSWISEVRPATSGDAEVILSQGTSLNCSRRYRCNLK
jgi:hypothetical protein